MICKIQFLCVAELTANILGEYLAAACDWHFKAADSRLPLKKKERDKSRVLCVYTSVYFSTLYIDITWHDDRRPFFCFTQKSLLWVRKKKRVSVRVKFKSKDDCIFVCILPNCQHLCCFISRFRFLLTRPKADKNTFMFFPTSGKMIHAVNVGIYELWKWFTVAVTKHLTYRHKASLSSVFSILQPSIDLLGLPSRLLLIFLGGILTFLQHLEGLFSWEGQ